MTKRSCHGQLNNDSFKAAQNLALNECIVGYADYFIGYGAMAFADSWWLFH